MIVPLWVLCANISLLICNDVTHYTKQERPDLVTVEGWFGEPTYLKIYQATTYSPYFNFWEPYFKVKLRHNAADLEVLDVNGDSYQDIFILQSDETKGYCGARGANGPIRLSSFWGGKHPQGIT